MKSSGYDDKVVSGMKTTILKDHVCAARQFLSHMVIWMIHAHAVAQYD